MSRRVFAGQDGLAAELARLTALAAAEAIAARGVFTMALTGGSAAEKLYPSLAAAPLDWARVHVFYGDERCVPPDHADSNHRLAERALLSRVPILAENVHRMRGEIDPADAAAEYGQMIAQVTGGSYALDAVHVGMGPDGHILSLFPGHPLLASNRVVAWLDDSPKPPPARVTLTLATLSLARAVWFLVAGENKAESVRAALCDPSSPLPAALAARARPDAVWLLDGAAARLLG